MSWTEKIPASLAKWGLIALFVLLVLAWLRYTPPESPWSPHRIIGMVMPESKVIARIEKQVIEGPERIRIIPKERIKIIYKDLPTPTTMQDNNAVVTAVCDIPAASSGGTAISVLTTGPDNVAVGSIEFKAKKVPFFQVKRDVGLRGGYGTEGIIGEVFVHPLRIGPMDLEGRAYGRSGNGDSEVGAAILFEARF